MAPHPRLREGRAAPRLRRVHGYKVVQDESEVRDELNMTREWRENEKQSAEDWLSEAREPSSG